MYLDFELKRGNQRQAFRHDYRQAFKYEYKQNFMTVC